MGIEAVKLASSAKLGSHLHTLQVETRARVEFKDITGLLQKLISDSSVESGVCHVFVPHTSAAVLVQENDDPALQKDFDTFLKQLAPRDKDYHHNDGNCDSHLKAALIGCSKTLLVENRRLVLGQWQGVFLCEFDGPRRREVRVKIVAD
ncbi:MAG: secondary thiamine-phosphate synthase enzyme YjbQ [Terriglobia bacterium]